MQVTDCFYIAAISPKNNTLINTNLPSINLPGGLYATLYIRLS